MAEQIGMVAKLRPKLDESAARRETERLSDMMGRAGSIDPSVSSRGGRTGGTRGNGRFGTRGSSRAALQNLGLMLPGGMGRARGSVGTTGAGAAGGVAGGVGGMTASEPQGMYGVAVAQLEAIEEIFEEVQDIKENTSGDALGPGGKQGNSNGGGLPGTGGSNGWLSGLAGGLGLSKLLGKMPGGAGSGGILSTLFSGASAVGGGISLALTDQIFNADRRTGPFNKDINNPKNRGPVMNAMIEAAKRLTGPDNPFYKLGAAIRKADIGSKLDSVASDIESGFDDAISSAQSALGDVTSEFGSWVDSVENPLPGISDSVSSWVDSVENPLPGITSELSSWANNLESDLKTTIESAREDIDDASGGRDPTTSPVGEGNTVAVGGSTTARDGSKWDRANPSLGPTNGNNIDRSGGGEIPTLDGVESSSRGGGDGGNNGSPFMQAVNRARERREGGNGGSGGNATVNVNNNVQIDPSSMRELKKQINELKRQTKSDIRRELESLLD